MFLTSSWVMGLPPGPIPLTDGAGANIDLYAKNPTTASTTTTTTARTGGETLDCIFLPPECDFPSLWTYRSAEEMDCLPGPCNTCRPERSCKSSVCRPATE